MVLSTAITDDNVEVARARERGQRIIHRGELLAELAATKRLIAVAGAHGKTTTSGMLAHCLATAGADPAYLIGGEPAPTAVAPAPTNSHWGGGDWLVAEADESDGSFLNLRPEVAAITNVELDHHSHWGGERELLAAFAQFSAPAAAVVRPAGPVLAVLDGGGISIGFALVERDGSGAGAASLVATDLKAVEGGTAFTLVAEGVGELSARLSIPGRHNVANALAAIGALIAARRLDPALPAIEELVEAVASFAGMRRRLERKGSRNGAVIYDDYAHHPTEVAASLAALRELPHRRLVAVFQPHLYSRTRALAARFGRALAGADEVGVLDVYAAREEPVGDLAGVSGLDVAAATADAAPGKRIRWLVDSAHAEETLVDEIGEGDILVTIGAGDVHELADALVLGGSA